MKPGGLAAAASMLAALGSTASGSVPATHIDRFMRHGAGETNLVKPRRNTGWTNARYQRAARKRRNQQLNRRAHRG